MVVLRFAGCFLRCAKGWKVEKPRACALIPPGLKTPHLRPASSAKFSSSSGMGSRELLR
jgi:hypothetical protein